MLPRLNELTHMTDDVHRCMKCGLCMAVCPIYAELGLESMVARGKLALMDAALEGRAQFSNRYTEIMSHCLLCKACVENCPSGVPTDRLMMATRADIASTRGLPLIKRAVFRIFLTHRPILEWSIALASRFQWTLFKKHPEGIQPRLPFGIDTDRVVSSLAPKPLSWMYPEVVSPPNPKMTVAFYTGCAIDTLHPHIGRAIINVLLANDIRVIIPKDQTCCGTPLMGHGDWEGARLVARKNIETFEKTGVDYIVQGCASCGCTLRHEYVTLFEHSDPDMAQRAAKFGSKVYDISEFLTEVIDAKPGSVPLELGVTHHDPCHLNRGQGVVDPPRKLMKKVPGLTIAEMSDPGRCCGGAGAFTLEHSDLSVSILDKKMEDVKSTGAKIIASGCPGCIMQLRDGVFRHKTGQPVVHPIELLEYSYGLTPDHRKDFITPY